jgi:hypothetical protein
VSKIIQPTDSQIAVMSNEQRIDHLCTWIDEHLDQRIEWSDLTHASGLDNLALRILFAKYRFIPPMTWIKLRREHSKTNEPLNPSADQAC